MLDEEIAQQQDMEQMDIDTKIGCVITHVR